MGDVTNELTEIFRQREERRRRQSEPPNYQHETNEDTEADDPEMQFFNFLMANDEEATARHIPGNTDETPSQMVMLHLGKGNSTCSKAEAVLQETGFTGTLNVIDKHKYYSENGYVVSIFETMDDAIWVYNKLNTPNLRIGALGGRHVRCYYYLGEPDSDQEEGIEEGEGGTPHPPSSSPIPRPRSNSSVLVDRHQQNRARSQSQGDLPGSSNQRGTGRREDREEDVPRLLDRRNTESNLSSETSPTLCKICFMNTIEYVFISCGHLFCSFCSSKLNQQCPMCKQSIRHKQRIFFS